MIWYLTRSHWPACLKPSGTEFTSVSISLISIWLHCCQATSARLPRFPAHSLCRYHLICIPEKYKETQIALCFVENSLSKSSSACTDPRQGLGRGHGPGTWDVILLWNPSAVVLYPSFPVLSVWQSCVSGKPHNPVCTFRLWAGCSRLWSHPVWGLGLPQAPSGKQCFFIELSLWVKHS